MSEQQPTFSVEKIYVKDLSLEVPNAPQCYFEREQPQIEVQLRLAGQGVGEGVFNVVLTVTVTAKAGDKTLFLVETSQGGLFQIRNVPEADLGPILNIECANILFPYLRETVSDCTVRAGFPPVILAPVNFVALYQQQLAAAQQAAAGVPHEIPVQ
jgi:preprotein translocase subunit SecB